MQPQKSTFEIKGMKTEKWVIDYHGWETWIQTEANKHHGHVKIARVYYGDLQEDEIEANAKLIARAPELLEQNAKLLEALKRCKYLAEKGRYKNLEDTFFTSEMKQINQAIKENE